MVNPQLLLLPPVVSQSIPPSIEPTRPILDIHHGKMHSFGTSLVSDWLLDLIHATMALHIAIVLHESSFGITYTS